MPITDDPTLCDDLLGALRAADRASDHRLGHRARAIVRDLIHDETAPLVEEIKALRVEMAALRQRMRCATHCKPPQKRPACRQWYFTHAPCTCSLPTAAMAAAKGPCPSANVFPSRF